MQNEISPLVSVVLITAGIYAIGFFVTFCLVLFHNTNTVLNDEPKLSPATSWFPILFIIWPNIFHIKE